MKFSVIWLADATEELIELWSDPEVRQSVVEGARRIETALSVNPQDLGESRPDNVRIIFESQLAAIYEVFSVERKVNILRIWYYSKH
jgi:hypothetical protein